MIFLHIIFVSSRERNKINLLRYYEQHFPFTYMRAFVCVVYIVLYKFVFTARNWPTGLYS